MNKPTYNSVKIKSSTYKELKLLAIELDMPVIHLIDLIFKAYKKA